MSEKPDHECPKCREPMTVSRVSKKPIRGAKCFCREALNYIEKEGKAKHDRFE